MFRPLRVCADVPSLRALLPLSLIARIHLSALPVPLSFIAGTLPRPKPPEVSEAPEADAGAQG
ncbi:hypothetical protein AB0B07_33725 [Streptomyces sioyaensis]|uniref:hypothetical protein n=1 Tax=Streptomyces sioyaensis TaxID=67364 RepID=UPI0033E31838